MEVVPYSNRVLEIADQLSTQQPVTPRPSKTGTKKLNIDTALQVYANTLDAIPTSDFEELDGAWLSDYGVKGKIPFTGDLDICPKAPLRVLVQIALSKGVTPKGFVAENKRKRAKSSEMRYSVDVGTDKRVYVGENRPKYAAPATRWSFKR